MINERWFYLFIVPLGNRYKSTLKCIYKSSIQEILTAFIIIYKMAENVYIEVYYS